MDFASDSPPGELGECVAISARNFSRTGAFVERRRRITRIAVAVVFELPSLVWSA